MASVEDWRSSEKRRVVIKQLEESIRCYPGTPPPNLSNPTEVERAVFEKSRGQEDYASTIRTVILMLAKGKYSGVTSQQQPPTVPVPQPQYGSMGMRGPNDGMGMNPALMNRQGMVYQQAPQMQPQMQYQPPQYNPGMQADTRMMVQPGVSYRQPIQTAVNYNQPPQAMGGYAGMPARYPGQPYVGGPAMIRQPRPTMMVRGPAMGGMVQGMRQTMNPFGQGGFPPESGPGSGMQAVTAVPNPSYPPSMSGVMTRPPSAPLYASNPPPTSNVQMPPTQGVPSQMPPTQGVPSQMPPTQGIPSQMPPTQGVPSQMPPTQGVPSPFSAVMGSPSITASEPALTSQTQTPPTSTNPPSHSYSQQSAPSPAPPQTPLIPDSPAIGSPAQQPSMTPEENEAYIRKLSDLQQYIPLLTRMLARISKHGDDNKRNDQSLKLKSLFNLLQDTNKRVPLQTLWKCGLALEKMAEQYNSRNGGEDPLQTPPATSSTSIAPQAPPNMIKPITELSNSKSLMDFKVIQSPPPSYSSLVETIQAKPLPSERLPPAKRHCNRAEPTLSPSLIRELTVLEQFQIHQLPPNNKFDRATVLKCTLADDGLPKVPSLTVRIPPNYPLVSPECDLTHYDATPFLKDVAKLLSERLARSNSVYTLSALLSGWESCVLRAMTNELTSQEE